ncbi:MAG TPA: hypothetical protein VEQ59_02355, partial [Polyangiaceae bacterium]|nr:hypothetical protein [Polyangiaceae bacterium]
MLLLCAGAAASLGSVWTLAGLAESAPTRGSARLAAAVAAGLFIEGLLLVRAPAELRGDLSLPLLFGSASLFALAIGAAKIEAALSSKDGPRVVRRSAGIVIGAVLGMAAIGAASLDLSSSSLSHARLGWAFMFALLASVLVVFSGRARYAGAGLLALGSRALLLSLVAAALLGGALLTVSASEPSASTSVATFSDGPGATAASAELRDRPDPAASGAPGEAYSADAPSAAPLASDSAAPAPSDAPLAATPASAAPSASAATPGAAGTIEIGTITARGTMDADVRGGVTHRLERLQACLSDPKNSQHGSLELKIGIDPSGSTSLVRPTGGDLKDTPLATCLVRVFYKMGFAAPASDNASFNIALRVP